MLFEDRCCRSSGETKRQLLLTSVCQCCFCLCHFCLLFDRQPLRIFPSPLPLPPSSSALTLPRCTCWVWGLLAHTQRINTYLSAWLKFLIFPLIGRSSHRLSSKATGLNLKDSHSEHELKRLELLLLLLSMTIACTWCSGLLLQNRPVKRHHFVADFAGSSVCGGKMNQALIL